MKNILKTFKTKIRILFLQKQKSVVIIALLFLSSCAAIPGKNVKLENYSEIKKEEIKNLSISFKYEPFKEKNDYKGSFIKINNDLFTKEKNKNTNCIAKISSRTDEKEVRKLRASDVVILPYYVVCQLSLFIIPCYKQHDYEAHATLISVSDNRILKEYYLKEKVHEIWSSLWAVSWFIYEPEFLKTPAFAKRETEEKLSEALVRSVLNDGSNFSECRK